MTELKPYSQLHAAHTFFVAFDSNLDVLELSAAFEKLTGAGVRGKPLAESFKLVKPRQPMSLELIEMFSGQLLGMVTQKIPELQFDGSVLKLSEDTRALVCFPQVTSISQLTDANLKLSDFLPHDPINFYIGMLHVKQSAVVEMQRVAEQLSRHKADLQEQVEERTRELLHAEKMASVGSLAAGVAHEINNPMSFVSSNLEYLKGSAALLERCIDQSISSAMLDGATADRSPTQAFSESDQEELMSLREEMTEILDDCLDGCHRVKDIVQSLKTFAHPDGGEKKLIKLEECLDVAIKVTSNEVRHKAQLTLDISDSPTIRGNASELSQVVVNLLVNASHAITAPPGHISVRLYRRDNQQICLSVSDDGCGINPEHLDKLFTPFFTTKDVGEGTGLGLAVSHGIMRKHGGDIEVASVPGKGATFTLVFGQAVEP